MNLTGDTDAEFDGDTPFAPIAEFEKVFELRNLKKVFEKLIVS